MKALQAILIIATVSLFLTSCFSSSWTEKQRKDFETMCTQTETFNNVVFQFAGFENSDFDSILIREFDDTVLVDTFKVFVNPYQSHDDSVRKERYTAIERAMNIKFKYQFVIPGEKPYELANMKMIMWAQYTMNSEGWGCVMGQYTIDGEKFEHNANPTFVKRKTNN